MGEGSPAFTLGRVKLKHQIYIQIEMSNGQLDMSLVSRREVWAKHINIGIPDTDDM